MKSRWVLVVLGVTALVGSSMAVVVSKEAVEKAEAAANLLEDSNDAAATVSSARVGHAPVYQYQEDHRAASHVEIAQSVEQQGHDSTVHMTPGAAAQLARQYHQQVASATAAAAAAAAAQVASSMPAGVHHHPKEGAANHNVEYVTYQYQGHHYDPQAEHPRAEIHHHQQQQHHQQHQQHQQQHHPAEHHQGSHPGNGYGAGYGLPVPVPVPHGHLSSHEAAAHAAHVDALAHQLHHEAALHHQQHQQHLEHVEHEHHVAHHPHPHHGAVQLRKVLVPLAGIALLGAAAALATNPVLLQLGVVSGKRRRRSASVMPMEHREMDADLPLDPEAEDDEVSTEETPSGEEKEVEEEGEMKTIADKVFANLTEPATDPENDINVRLREIMVLETFLKAQAQEPERRSGPFGPADGALASLLTCSGLLNAHSSVCLQRMACEAHSQETDLPNLELQVIKIVMRELLEHDGIPKAVKLRLRAAVAAGAKGHRCDAIYRCPPKAWTRCTEPAPSKAKKQTPETFGRP